MKKQQMIELTRVKQEAWPDTNMDGWNSRRTGSWRDGREILRPMETEKVYVNPTDVIAVQPVTIRVDWDEDHMERPCRNVGKKQPWWVDEEGSLVHIRQVGKWTVLEFPEIVRGKVEG